MASRFGKNGEPDPNRLVILPEPVPKWFALNDKPPSGPPSGPFLARILPALRPRSGRAVLGVGAAAFWVLLRFLLGDDLQRLQSEVGPCRTVGKYYRPQDFEGESKTEEMSWEACNARCGRSAGCGFFNFWPDGTCHLSRGTSVPTDTTTAVIGGPQVCPSPSAPAATGGIMRSSLAPRSALELWRIDGAYYDFVPLLSDGHPGGPLIHQQTRGSDVSLLFRVQHLGSYPRNALEKYRVHGEVVHDDLIASEMPFSFHPEGFYERLKERIRAFLKEEIGDRSPRKASWLYLAKLGANVVLFVGSWLRLNFYPFDIPTCLANAMSRMVLIGLGHDAIHGILMPGVPFLQSAYAHTIFRGFLTFPSEKWHKEHVIGHHPYTKTHLDPDENLKQYIPFWRLTNVTRWSSKHSWPLTSHFAIGLLFPILNGMNQLPKLLSPFAAMRGQGALALSTVIFFHLLPLFSRPLREGIVVYALTSMLSSLAAVLAFHVSHLGDHLEVTFSPGVDWGEHQMRTSTNFDASYSIGGTLDLQIEHHLFPMLSYENQQAVSPIVRRTAEEFGIPYNCYRSLLGGWYRHLTYMVALGLGYV